jgi:O-antigen ligase
MFAIPGILLLVLFIYVRPQEIVEPLQTVPLLYIFLALALFGLAIDWRQRNLPLRATPQLPFALALLVWCMVSALVFTPREVHVHALEIGVPIVLFLLIAHAVQSFRMLHVIAGTVLAVTLFVAAVGIHQGFGATGCIAVDESVVGDQTVGTYDGRPCETSRECYLGDAEPGAQYLCEKVGLFGTHSVSKGRVRYRGVLQDPNELALVAGIALPLAFALGWRRGRPKRWMLGLLAISVVLVATVLTRSRGGQLVFLAVLGAYFLRRFGARGALAGGVLGLPVLALGWRGGAEAASSTLERIDCWYEAINMLRSNPLLGVGFYQFGEYHYLTAHNSYLLAAAELGLPGLALFSIVLYLSVKIPLLVYRRYRTGAALAIGDASVVDRAHVARVWSMALLASYAGLLLGIFFLSFVYHPVLWIYIGLSAALYLAVKRHDASFEVRFTWRDLVLVAAADAAILGLIFIYTRIATA